MAHDVIGDSGIVNSVYTAQAFGQTGRDASTHLSLNDMEQFLIRVADGKFDARRFAADMNYVLDASVGQHKREGNPLPVEVEKAYDRTRERLKDAADVQSNGGTGLTLREAVLILGNLGQEVRMILNPEFSNFGGDLKFAPFLEALGLDNNLTKTAEFKAGFHRALDESLERYKQNGGVVTPEIERVYEQARIRLKATTSPHLDGGTNLTGYETRLVLDKLQKEITAVLGPGNPGPLKFMPGPKEMGLQDNELAQGLAYFALMTTTHTAPKNVREAFAKEAQARTTERLAQDARWPLQNLISSFGGNVLRGGQLEAGNFIHLIESTKENFLKKYGDHPPEGAGNVFTRAIYRTQAAASPHLDGGENITKQEAALIVGTLGNELKTILQPDYTAPDFRMKSILSAFKEAQIDDNESAAGYCFLQDLNEKLSSQSPVSAATPGTKPAVGLKNE